MTIEPLPDVQSASAVIPLDIDWVGVSHLRQPVLVLDRSQAKQATVADLEMSVDLGADHRGAHLSRFLEVLAGADDELTVRTAERLLASMRHQLRATRARVVASFPYFIDKRAPITGVRGLLDIPTTFTFTDRGQGIEFLQQVCVPVTTLCPCSREVSDYGAHNQRCNVTIAVRVPTNGNDQTDSIVWIEELVALAESNASAPIYPALKRPDERHVTMLAYDNPAFVEDVVRGVARELAHDHRVEAFSIEASSDESIHNHRAFARIGQAST